MTAATQLKSAPTLESLAQRWTEAKDRETLARADRLAIEEGITAMLPSPTPEGTNARDVGPFRVVVKYGVTRKVDTDALQVIWEGLPPEAHSVFKWSAALTLPKWRALKDLRPDVYARLVPCVETKESKPSVDVARIEKAA